MMNIHNEFTNLSFIYSKGFNNVSSYADVILRIPSNTENFAQLNHFHLFFRLHYQRQTESTTVMSWYLSQSHSFMTGYGKRNWSWKYFLFHFETFWFTEIWLILMCMSIHLNSFTNWNFLILILSPDSLMFCNKSKVIKWKNLIQTIRGHVQTSFILLFLSFLCFFFCFYK